ncbi:hormonally up-regulated neu tumor-associated kinase homolog isoform X2 [Mercenaria mercenaria]|uniref:hormonally up-regulated neu tumor-associated kinase homolog isoform X2 n=1 Tax=Mercenaria mercenaria TaxID=6596 RepID=UPI00234E4A15|nr:hormonally up-regulated neu tumor-associated kinase homolog isoform X2 [Mercenaria mercenaria]
MTVISMIPNDTPYLPPKVIDVPKDILRNFPHSKKVGNYLLGNTLGEGSFAKVKEALHIPTGERVAVKIIDKKKSREDSYVRKNLRREGKILQMIRHTNILHLLEIMETQNSYYLVTELCRGGDLMDYISQKRKLPENEVKKYIRQIISAVDYLHRLGILHRDLKIENLLLDEFKDMKIIDFGLSNSVKVVDTKDGPKVQEFCVTQCGSPAYAAPELLGRKKYGPQVDIWSIGVNMYAMLTGNLPFTVEPFNIKALHNKMISSQMNPLPEGLSRDCRDIIKKLLNPDPDRRITMDEILKHPWVAEGPGIPLGRAPCPNKMKTDTLDNSILKHMSENQGFRIGEVIRYVTGNVPSSATAMYYLIYRKLIKHLGNLRASGKIPADHRILHRTQLSNDPVRGNPKSYTTQQISRHLVNHTSHSVKNAVQTQQKTREKEMNGNSGDGYDGKDDNDDNAKDTEEEKSENEEVFTDILQTKGTNGYVKIPRASSPMKPVAHDKTQATYLPHVANKYVLGNRRVTPPNVPAQSPDNKIDQNVLKHDVKLSDNKPDHTVSKHNGKLSATETTDAADEQFRPRAATFPGKIQRPVTTIQKLMKDRGEIEPSDKADGSVKTRVYRTKTDPTNNSRRDYIENRPSTPVSRRGSPFQMDGVQSPTPRHTRNTQILLQYRKKSTFQRRIANVNKTKDGETSKDSIHEEDISIPSGKHVLSRPSRTNKFYRTSAGSHTAREDTVVNEHVTEISKPTSARNVPVNFRSATPVLPSLSLQHENGKRNQ